jgi:hypothetical protein
VTLVLIQRVRRSGARRASGADPGGTIGAT